MKDLVIYGAGGFGREIAAIIQSINKVTPTWNALGFIDDGVPAGTSNSYGKVLGNLSFLNEFPNPISVVIAIASPKILEMLVQKITNPNISYPNIIAPDVLFFDKATLIIGKGNVLGFGCRLSTDVKLGNFNMVNGMTSIGHDVKIGDYNVFQPETRISGETNIGNSNFFGVRSLALQGLKIGNHTRIGAGSVVMRNTKDNCLYLGNPAKRVEI